MKSLIKKAIIALLEAQITDNFLKGTIGELNKEQRTKLDEAIINLLEINKEI